MREAVIAAAVRTAVGRAIKGTLRLTRPDDLAAAVLREALARTPNLPAEGVDDIILGCAMPEAEQGYNVARVAALRAGIPDSVPAMTINRFCSSGLQAVALASDRIVAGGADVILAGGTESMSMVPIGGHSFSPNPWLMENRPDSYLSMGLTAEKLAVEYGISRAEADAFALRSHTLALAARDAGEFEQEIVGVRARAEIPATEGAPARFEELTFDRDEGPRADTSLDALSRLKPVFDPNGTVTAGNSSQMSDGAAACVVLSAARARELGVQPLGRLVAYATAGVAPGLMGIGPVAAIPRALKLAGLSLDNIGLIELNEAFAVQALAVIRLAGLDAGRVNVNGGGIALGHPLGATGAKLTATLLYAMARRGIRYGMVTMCVGGGMGAAGIFENLTLRR